MLSESIFQGTILCKFHAKGKCRKGESCKFAHGKTALKFKPDLSKTKMCTTFRVTGDCKYGEDCTYAHDRTEIRRNIMKKQKEAGLRPPAPTAPRSASAPNETLTSVNDVDLTPVRHHSANHAKIVDDLDLSLPIPIRSESSNSQASTVCPPTMTITCSVEDVETPFSRTVTWASSYNAADSVSDFEEEELPCLGVLVGRSATWADTGVEAEDQPAPVGRSATWAPGSEGLEETAPCLGVLVGRRARWADISMEAEDHPEPAGRSATWGHSNAAVFEDMENPLPVDPIAFANTSSEAESNDDEILNVFVKNTFLHFQPAALPLGPLRHTKSLPLLSEKAGDEP